MVIVGIYNKMHAKEAKIKNRATTMILANMFKANKLETRNILFDEENYNDLAIYFTRYVYKKSIKKVRSALA